ncbi:hypothetical protein BIFPSEUDO_02866 [Bifidobacterium pseudocatenulatum DSM 20438 = JCM 1200 = LMG 10505]|uniref:Uncharacterized protein n=1 Tax=Bifidobacterium pseudocatenulatum DSM 20438 = JCM 1200 = LMG 10505 TaxID=547043 RepID=C0BR59_BIFPS|nr:hypothetical protein BIFPSEUDO_02866 [Bifidobacterium pseudocatenulatum DSM 20438 = JCM 1200 = LMG 10505]
MHPVLRIIVPVGTFFQGCGRRTWVIHNHGVSSTFIHKTSFFEDCPFPTFPEPYFPRCFPAVIPQTT